jgi:hypothetical protein
MSAADSEGVIDRLETGLEPDGAAVLRAASRVRRAVDPRAWARTGDEADWRISPPEGRRSAPRYGFRHARSERTLDRLEGGGGEGDAHHPGGTCNASPALRSTRPVCTSIAQRTASTTRCRVTGPFFVDRSALSDGSVLAKNLDTNNK